MKSLVIAEKPSVARDIARVLHCSQKGNGTLEGKDYVVTWALGHLVTLADPEGYDPKYKAWNAEDLPMPIPNNEKIFGKQQLYNADDEVIGTIPNLLINATDISFDDVFDLTKDYHGIMIPAHIDKTANSLLANLGFIPPDSRFTCAEIKDMSKYHELKKQHPYLEHCHIISDSDAHYLEHINEPHYTLSVKSRNPKDILSALTTAV